MSENARKRIRLQLMWDRLIAVVEEQAQAILRTAFGSVVREAGDLSTGIYDLEGRMLAQAVTGTPGHVNTMAKAVMHFLDRFPLKTMKPGDVFVTNDPWMGTGHLFDFVVVSPAFYHGQTTALFASTCHVIDVGGRGFSAEARSIYEEGVRIPHMKLREEKRLNEVILSILEANSRNPVEMKGDLLSLITCNDTAQQRLDEMMGEFNLDSLEELGQYILEQSYAAMKKAINKVPPGDYAAEMKLDGYERELLLRARMSVLAEEILIDYSGSSAASNFGINSPFCYTEAYTFFGLKSILAPEVPNNHGSLRLFRILAEEGSAVHPLPPSPVTARHVIGQMLPDLAFGCLSQVLPGKVPAESAGSIWVLPFSDDGNTAQPFNVMNVGMGGVGARPGKDGLSVTAFPSGVGSIPIEVTESDSPIVFWRKEYLPDSGGPGEFRGGLGQVIEVGSSNDQVFTISAATFDRMKNPPRGREGGLPGKPGKAGLENGLCFKDKAVYRVPPEERLILELPGGGGLGDPKMREAEKIQEDLEAGYVTHEGVLKDYGQGE
ncbi:MAG: hydantoinase B/oxoprolinase family protein [SAR324 cluster bacterium]|jgi:N-methylhydantoinase B|nr:5-oxoprolinase [Pseudomonadota bacterium]MDP6092743.1 hydantoinase B/oxoprolinase family protein [SAR324 cluster bacterium]MDP6247878.1 hydantoinase B/oxoprolinase family protein [SAR324 cluster bacterium]MDP6463887.1 hydantoinase B/oxoprolinase family protein [SAR324 cluster bacterium]MDP6637641.1 hydantoinase B/oxoprolinase family protein [SAR324 cluster bacterium]|tara:strand:- start:928 stop:2574 length:1647 start_codon:yes stop_codon:yes gene_type:complete